MNKDLTKGEPSRVLWSFCLPLFGSIIFQQLYNIADSLIAGKFVGENALAAVGNSYEITLIFIAVAFGCNIGCSVIVSRYFGSGEIHNVKTAVYTTFLSGGILCLLLMGAGILGCDFMLGLIHTPAEIMADCHRDFFCHGRFQNAVCVPGLFLHCQYSGGLSFCTVSGNGSCRRGMGYLSVSGRKLHSCHCCYL